MNLFLQFFGDRSKGLQYFVECTKLYPKAHALYLGPLLSVLVVHHPDTVKIVCGPGNLCLCVCMCGYECVCYVCIVYCVRLYI